jgi:hypothetical protein
MPNDESIHENVKGVRCNGCTQGHLIFKNSPRMTPMPPMGADQIGEHPPHPR